MSKRPSEDASNESSDDEYGPMPVKVPAVAPVKALSPDEIRRAKLLELRRQKQRAAELNEKYHLERLPQSALYEKSYMHRTPISHIVPTPRTGFIATASLEGTLKLWKKKKDDIEFVKTFRAHVGFFTSVAVSLDGMYLATSGEDGVIRIFDVMSFDNIMALEPGFIASSLCWVHPPDSPTPLLAVGVETSLSTANESESHSSTSTSSPAPGEIYIFSTTSPEPLLHQKIHTTAVSAMVFHPTQHYVISADTSGMIQYWTSVDKSSRNSGSSVATSLDRPKSLDFEFYSETDLMCFVESKTPILGLSISPTGSLFAAVGKNRHIYIFRSNSGVLVRTIDESISRYDRTQKLHLAKAASKTSQVPAEDLSTEEDLKINLNNYPNIEKMSYGHRRNKAMEVEKALNSTTNYRKIPPPQICFDISGNFLIYPSIAGIKVFNIRTEKVEKFYGMNESVDSFLSIAILQDKLASTGSSYESAFGADKITVDPKQIDPTVKSSAGSNSGQSNLDEDPSIFALAYESLSFFIFTNRQPADQSTRDVRNEKVLGKHALPGSIGSSGISSGSGSGSGENESTLSKQVITALGKKTDIQPQSKTATIHTTMGDISVEFYPTLAPKAVKNFTQLSSRGYYDGTIFHRVIKDFMIQGGDPSGDGTGGQSIWGTQFADEISPLLQHDGPGILSMANSGPDTNGSQFFITTASASHLNGKHTIFGRVTNGLEVVHAIERTPANPRNNRPISAIKIINVSL